MHILQDISIVKLVRAGIALVLAPGHHTATVGGMTIPSQHGDGDIELDSLLFQALPLLLEALVLLLEAFASTFNNEYQLSY